MSTTSTSLLVLPTLQPSIYTFSAKVYIYNMNLPTSNDGSSLTPCERRKSRPEDSDQANQQTLSSSTSSLNQRSAAASHAPLSPAIEDGFTLVSRPAAKARTTAHNKTSKSYAPSSHRSAAAVSRAGVYKGPIPNKPPSHYKQSCLPVEERDTVLLEAERSKGRKLPKQSFRPGTIIRAVLHEPDFGVAGASDVTLADRFRTNSIHGPIYTKTRKMIVLATFQDNYIAVPLYTHNGRGLDGKANPDEFISIQDHRAAGSFTPLSIHRPLVTEHLNTGTELFDVKTTVHITYPVSRKYTLPVVQEGRLKDESVQTLATLFGDYISPFLKP